MLRSAMTKAGRIVAADAKARVPVLTGALRKSIKVTGLAKQGVVATAAGFKSAGKAGIGKRVRATLPYAAIIELGSRRTRPKPYLGPALKDNAQRVQEFIRDDVKRQMQEMGQGRKLGR